MGGAKKKMVGTCLMVALSGTRLSCAFSDISVSLLLYTACYSHCPCVHRCVCVCVCVCSCVCVCMVCTSGLKMTRSFPFHTCNTQQVRSPTGRVHTHRRTSGDARRGPRNTRRMQRRSRRLVYNTSTETAGEAAGDGQRG